MAYQIQKRTHIREELQLADETGQVRKTLVVDIVPDVFRERFMAASKAINEINNLDADDAEKIRQMREAVLGFFDTILGEAQAKELVDFYDGMVTEAFVDIVPFVTDVIKPRLEAAVSAEKERFQRLMQ